RYPNCQVSGSRQRGLSTLPYAAEGVRLVKTFQSFKPFKLFHLNIGFGKLATEKNRIVDVMRLSLLLFALLHSFGFRQAAESKLAWQVNWEKIVAAARKEGEVRLWGDQEITHPDIVAAFTKEYPFIKPVTVSGRVGELMPRIIAERRAGKYLADLYSGGLGGRSFFDLLKTGVLDPIKPLLLLPDVVDGSKWLNGEHYYADSEQQFVFMYEGSVAGVGLH